MTMRRTFATCVLATSIACYLGFMPFGWVYFDYTKLFSLPPHIWRLVTSFFLTEPQLGVIMDTYFVFQYASQLETAHPKFGRKEDFLWYLVFCGTVIIVRYPGPQTHVLVFPALPMPQLHTSYICPDSEVPLLLSRFLERREITPALRPVHHSQYLVKGRPRCGHGGMSLWMTRVLISVDSGGFERPTLLQHYHHLLSCCTLHQKSDPHG